MSDRLIHKEISESVIGAAMTVLNELKPGLHEKLYENALLIELNDRGHKVEQQRSFPVHFKGHLIGALIPDMIIDGVVIVDTKVVTTFCDTDIAQMVGYLAKTDLKLALLLNFKHTKLQWKRVIRDPRKSVISAV